MPFLLKAQNVECGFVLHLEKDRHLGVLLARLRARYFPSEYGEETRLLAADLYTGAETWREKMSALGRNQVA